MAYSAHNINLLPESRLMGEAAIGKWLVFLLTVGRVVVVITVFVVAAAYFFRFQTDQQFFTLKKSIAQKQQVLSGYRDIESRLILAQNRVGYAKTILAQRGRVDMILDVLLSIVPNGVTFQTLAMTRSQVVLSGKATDSSAFGAFLTQLTSASWAANVTIDSVTAGPGGVTFSLKYAVGAKP